MRYYKSKNDDRLVKVDNEGWLYTYSRYEKKWLRYFKLHHPDQFLEERYNTSYEITEQEAFIEIL